MLPLRSAAGAWLVVVAATAASAQTAPFGTYSLSTRYAFGGGTTDTAIRIRADGPGRVKVDRTARYRDAAHASQAPFRYYGKGVQLSANWLRVDYRVTPSGGISSLLSPDDYRFRGYYYVSGDRIREILINQTQTGDHAGWSRADSQGAPDDAFVRAARGEAGELVEVIMNYRTDVADYYEPGDEDYYRDDTREAEFYFERALWVEVPALAGEPAFKTLQAINMDRSEVVSPGQAFVLLDANAQVLKSVYRDESGELFDDDGSISPPPPPPPPGPPVVVDCPLGGKSVAELKQTAAAQVSSLTDFIMNFRTDIADYYDWGDQAYYDADTVAAEAYFRAASWDEVPVPAGYSAYKALKGSAPDPTDVILGSITLLFDCDGNVIETVYDHEGEVYDSGDM